MSFCEYCKVGAYTEFCTCTKEQDICPFVRRCTTNPVWLPLDSMDRCTRRFVPTQNRKEDIMLQEGEYRVEYVKHGKLYINVDGNLMRMANPYSYEPQKVKLVRINDEIYIEDFAPKAKEVVEESKEEKKTTTSKKKSNKSKKGE